MIIETLLLLLTVIVALGAYFFMLYKWRQDVLYGPYIHPE